MIHILRTTYGTRNNMWHIEYWDDELDYFQKIKLQTKKEEK